MCSVVSINFQSLFEMMMVYKGVSIDIIEFDKDETRRKKKGLNYNCSICFCLVFVTELEFVSFFLVCLMKRLDKKEEELC